MVGSVVVTVVVQVRVMLGGECCCGSVLSGPWRVVKIHDGREPTHKFEQERENQREIGMFGKK